MHPNLKLHAFSLVEVVIAMGIAAVSVVTAIGVLGASLHSRSLSADDTVCVSMTEHILSEIRSVPFDTLWKAVPGGTVSATQSAAPPEDTRYYFSQEGDVVTESDSRAFYECIVKKLPDQTTRSPKDGPYNLLKLELSFSSPVSALTASRRPNERSLYASVARY